MTYNILVSCPHLQRTIDRYGKLFSKYGLDVELPPVEQKLTESELLDIIHNYHGVIAGDDEITRNVLEKAKILKVISKWGVGIDSIDISAAKKFGIRVYNTPNVFGEEVADVVMGYIILLARQLHIIDQKVRDGEWNDAQIQGFSLNSKTLGVIGIGSIGKAVVKRARAAGMEVLGYDIAPIDDIFMQKSGMRQVDIDTLLKCSDIVSLNCNLTTSNHHMIGKDALEKMKNSAYLINTSRGPLIDENALIEALINRKIAGAALDVFEDEPLPGQSKLRSLPNCIFGAHNSSNTIDAVLQVNQLAIDNLLKGLGIERNE